MKEIKKVEYEGFKYIEGGVCAAKGFKANGLYCGIKKAMDANETPNGNEVRGISLSDVEDIFEVRKRLEVLATKKAADSMTDEHLAELKDVVERQEYYAGKGDVQKVRDLDTEFHDLIYSGCGSVTLQSILAPIHHKLMKFRKASLEHEGRILESVAEHRAILDAIVSGNKEKIDALMLKHIEEARKNVIDAM